MGFAADIAGLEAGRSGTRRECGITGTNEHEAGDQELLAALEDLEASARRLREGLMGPRFREVTKKYGDARLRRLVKRVISGMGKMAEEPITQSTPKL